MPDGLDPALAVCLGVSGLAAWLGAGVARPARSRARPCSILGASGVVGQIAVQAAQLLGAGRVVAAARDATGLERARRPGRRRDGPARRRRRRRSTGALREAAGGDGYDVVLDPLWGEPAQAAIGAVKSFGRLVNLGQSAGAEATLDLGRRSAPSRSTCSATRTTPPARSARPPPTRELARARRRGRDRGRDRAARPRRRARRLAAPGDSPHAKLVVVRSRDAPSSRAPATHRSSARRAARAGARAREARVRLLEVPAERAPARAARGRRTASSAVSTRGGSAGISRCSRSASANAGAWRVGERAVGGERLRRASPRRPARAAARARRRCRSRTPSGSPRPRAGSSGRRCRRRRTRRPRPPGAARAGTSCPGSGRAARRAAPAIVARRLLDVVARLVGADADPLLAAGGHRPGVAVADQRAVDPDVEVGVAAARVGMDLEPARDRRLGRLHVRPGAEHAAPAERVDDQRRGGAAVGATGSGFASATRRLAPRRSRAGPSAPLRRPSATSKRASRTASHSSWHSVR